MYNLRRIITAIQIFAIYCLLRARLKCENEAKEEHTLAYTVNTRPLLTMKIVK